MNFDEFCPECSQWKPLIEETGWCLPCTRDYHPDLNYCEHCGKSFKRDGQLRTLCPSCRLSDWQARNADAIERYMRAGLTYTLAKERVAYDNRPVCVSCGNKIKGGTKGRHHFCNVTAQCRTAARRYKYYKEAKGMQPSVALQATIETLTAGVAA